MKATINITCPALTLFALTCFAFSQMAQAQLSPPPVGGYPNQNTATGTNALFNGANSVGNTAIGDSALFNTTTGNDNTGVGKVALSGNTIGIANTAIGSSAMQFNNVGSHNTGIGQSALANNLSGNFNTASGEVCLGNNQTGNDNCAYGFEALADCISGSDNAAYGYLALHGASGSGNIGIGSGAGENLTSGANNIAMGFNAGINLTAGSNNIEIGNVGNAADSRIIRIGKSGTQTKTFVAGISGATVAGGVGVIVGSNGQLGTVVSSERFKQAIQPMDRASEAILALKPVTFRYKKDLDPDGIPQFGLVAEEVEKVNPDLVARDEQGTPYTVRYEAVNAMLLNEFLKEHKKVEKLEGVIASLAATTKEQADLIQKVSAQLEVNKPAPKTVSNNH